MKYKVTFAQVNQATYEVEAEEEAYAVIAASRLWQQDECPPSCVRVSESK